METPWDPECCCAVDVGGAVGDVEHDLEMYKNALEMCKSSTYQDTPSDSPLLTTDHSATLRGRSYFTEVDWDLSRTYADT